MTGIAGMTAVELDDNPVIEPRLPGHEPIVCIAKTAPRSCKLILPQSASHKLRIGPRQAVTEQILTLPCAQAGILEDVRWRTRS